MQVQVLQAFGKQSPRYRGLLCHSSFDYAAEEHGSFAQDGGSQ